MKVGYKKFLKTKERKVRPSGFDIDDSDLNTMLYDFQNDITRWALRLGKAAIFADCGLGKTPIQLEWAHQVWSHELDSNPFPNILIVAPLAVSTQTIREGDKFGIEVNRCRSQSDVVPGINITNYEMVHKFDPDKFCGIVLDESSILKSYSGKYRQELTDFAQNLSYKLCCTATPAPNDLIEIINHAEFLGILTGKEVIALYFKQDGNTTHSWKLKGHAVKDFWKWVAGWACAIRKPSDMGYSDDMFILPELNIIEHTVQQDHDLADGHLFAQEGLTLNEQRSNRKATVNKRVKMALDIINKKPNEQWLIWCNLNDESDKAKKALDAVEVKGSDSMEHKENSLIGFSTGDINRMVTKPSIAGFGMNWQSCANVVFLGLDHSYEKFYQAVRRVWRFGQKRPVNVHVIMASTDGEITRNIKRKERQAMKLMGEIVKQMQDIQLDRVNVNNNKIETSRKQGNGWKLYRGDSIELIKTIKDESVGLSVFSPPFPGMYVYTDSERDIGNCTSIDQLMNHFSYMMPDLLRITKPGRSCCVHLCQGVAFKWIDGYIGMKDFRGKVIEAMQDAGWIYYGEVCIDKNPQVKAVRTKDQGLLFKSLAKDAARLHPALADYILQFRKPGDCEEPIKAGISEKYNPNGEGWVTAEEWIRWARPVWYGHDYAPDGDGIRETDVLNVKCARGGDDEKHLCPLQLGVIERCVKLWSNPGDTIFSPFAGIGSEGYQAIKFGREFIGIELKQSYFDVAVKNLKAAKPEKKKQGLFE